MADTVNELLEAPSGTELIQDGAERSEEEEPQAPYFFYRDHSHLPDPDPSKPVTVPGRIPTFPAKLFAILSRPELADIISWMPHGRSWKVHKPREFEVKVIPSYFDHAKFSSFIRQANGWGFKRVCTKGVDRNSHYHELFLRGMPHLIKFMKRPVSGTKIPSQPLHLKGKNCDPDFYRISQEHPLPEFTPKMMHPLDESNFLNSGANNRMLGSASEKPIQPSQGLPQAHSPNTSGQHGDQQLAQQLQSFFTSDDNLFFDITPLAEQPTSYTPANQAFLLPRVVESSTTEQSNGMMPIPPITSSNMCPVRQQEKDLDPLTILLNDVFDEENHVDDPVIQSLLSAPSVPPPSSLNTQHVTPLSHPATPPMEPREVISHHTLYQAPMAPPMVQVVSPVEEKHIMELPEPAYVHFGQNNHMAASDDMSFFDPFAGGLVAQDFW